MSDAPSHWPDVRDKPGFLRRLMVALAGGAEISLEGNLSRCRFADDLVRSRDDAGTLKRGTLWPRQDFVVLRLEPETIAPIFAQVMAAGLKRNIIHIQIHKGGALELGAYDSFGSGSVVTGPGVSAALLAEMQANGVIRSFAVANPTSHAASSPK